MGNHESTVHNRRVLTDTAVLIARRLADSATWHDDVCTWPVTVPDAANRLGGRGIAVPATGTLYQGTAGIALFLAEAHSVVPDSGVARALRGALEHALQHGEALEPDAVAFHTGRVGIAFAAARCAELLQCDRYRDGARRMLAPITSASIANDRGLDVIGGAAGAIPALLLLGKMLGTDHLLDTAQAFGRHLAKTAQWETTGWSWRSGLTTGAMRDLCGLAHGASGMGHALLELYVATGDAWARYGAEAAFAYEREFFNSALDNWPDFRDTEVMEAMVSGNRDALRARVATGEALTRPARYMSAWCHGATGIGLSRLRAHEVLCDGRYLAEAQAAVRASEAACGVPAEFSLCHGNAARLLLMHGAGLAWNDDTLTARAEQLAASACETYEGARRPWPSGALGSVPEPSLMMGDAGVGYALLRLAAPAPASVLLLTVDTSTVPDVARIRWPEESAALRWNTALQFFARSARVLEQLAADEAAMLSRAVLDAAVGTELRAARIATLAIADRHRDTSMGAVLADAFRLDLAQCDVADASADLRARLSRMLRAPESMPDVAETPVHLAPDVRLVETHVDWDAWEARADAAAPALADTPEAAYLVHHVHERVVVRRLTAFQHLVFSRLRAPATHAELIAHIAPSVAVAESVLNDRVREQVTAALRAGVLTPTGTLA